VLFIAFSDGIYLRKWRSLCYTHEMFLKVDRVIFVLKLQKQSDRTQET